MAYEEGVVTKVEPSHAWVKTTRSSACKSCASRDACSANGDGQQMTVRVLNGVGARVGDRIIVSFDTAPLLKATFLLYVFPIICMLAGAFIGLQLTGTLPISETALSVLGGFLFFFLAVIFIKIKGNKLSEKKAYQPKITRIIHAPK
jgi:sigma-E factor negative regulatory protein RseC